MFRPKLNHPSPMRPSPQSTRQRPQTPLSAAKRKQTPWGQSSSFGRNRTLNQSELPSGIEELGPEHILSEYGTTTPLAVTEALTLLPRGSQRPSAKLDQNGWVWIVCGHKVITWNFQNVSVNKIGKCFELLLPASDFGLSADLVAVFTNSDRQSLASCLAVSPDGIVRYWYDVNLENSYQELNIGVPGESFAALSILQPPESNCLAATSSSTLVHIYLKEMRYRVMSSGQGVLSGLGRRVSSLFFGRSQPQQPSAAGSPLHKLLAGETLGLHQQSVYVLTGGNLQKWTVSSDQERLLYECSVESMFKEHLSYSVWKKDLISLPRLSVWLMDVQLVRDGIMILGAGVNPESSNDVFYALGIMHTEGESVPQGLLTFSVTDHHAVYENDNESQFRFGLLVPNLSSLESFLYNRSTIACILDGKPEEAPDVVDFSNLGAGCCDGFPVFVSSQGQLVKIQLAKALLMNSAAEILSKTTSFSKLDTSILATANLETVGRMNASGDPLTRLKAAFLMSIRDTTHQSDVQSVVTDLFPAVVPLANEPGSLLDTAVISLSREMVDDYPASDPRWAESLPSGSVSTSLSLILLHQLDDKQKAHALFVNFLKTYGLWDRLSLSVVRDGIMTTQLLLCEHAEKIEAMKALRNRHNDNAALVDKAIEIVLERRSVEPFNHLTPQDLFYREVSNVHEIMCALIECEEEQLAKETNSQAIISLISSVNTILKEMIFAATNYRLAQMSLYDSSVSSGKEFVAWTASSGPRGVRSVLRHQYEISVGRGLSEAQNSQDKGTIFQQLLDLSDMLLDGYRAQLDSLRAKSDAHYVEVFRKYEQERAAVIRPFMAHLQYERAASLAEKYCDFATLVQLCDELDNSERLQMYMEKFRNEGFSDFVYQWHVNAGKRGKLLKTDYFSNPSLKNFLDSEENKYLSWLHDISANDYEQAHLTLLELGNKETEYLARKKTLLSLSKLTALASVEKKDVIDHNMEEINQELDLILHQEQLMSSPHIQESLAIHDPDNMKVLSVDQLIDLYIGDYNVGANELDFKKALDLLSFVDKTNPTVHWQDTLLQIWSKAILCDGWNHRLSATDPIEACRDTVFYKTLELVLAEDGNLEELLPCVDDLISSEILGKLHQNREFQCLLRALYEHFHRMIKMDS